MSRSKVIAWVAVLTFVGVAAVLLARQSDSDRAPSSAPHTATRAVATAPAPRLGSNAEPSGEAGRPAPDAVQVAPQDAGLPTPQPTDADDASPEPNDASNAEAQNRARLALNGRLFADLPFDQTQEAVAEIGLDRIDGMNELLEQARVLRRAIEDSQPDAVAEAAQEYLRAASKLQTAEAQQQYHALMKKHHRELGDSGAEIADIKQVLIPAFGYAQELARVR